MHSLFTLATSLLPLLSLPTAVTALPATLDAAAYTALANRYTNNDIPQSDMCDTREAIMPQAPTPLPPPCANCTLTHVVLGRGTQNYTCASSSASETPKPAGALASLFNTTCIASTAPPLLRAMAGIALGFPVPPPTVRAANELLSGVHFFSDGTTPVFDLDTGRHAWGKVFLKKTDATPAPAPDLDVAWLKLVQKKQENCGIQEVYRVNTAGGVPPKTCEGQPEKFEVQYAAEYWLWSGPSAEAPAEG